MSYTKLCYIYKQIIKKKKKTLRAERSYQRWEEINSISQPNALNQQRMQNLKSVCFRSIQAVSQKQYFNL